MNEYDLTGFAFGNTGGGIIPETDSAYIKVYDASDFARAIRVGNGYKVIEIMNDLNLGWNEIDDEAKAIAQSKFVAHNTPLTHPVLMRTGVSRIYIDDFSQLTLFSVTGAVIRHAALDIRRSSNVIIRNLEFDELWEWDEASKGNYDRQDWDFVTLQHDRKVWIDHCTFHKAYDGIVDMKQGTSGVTISWSKFNSDRGDAHGWVRQQLQAMEADRSSYPMYDFIRAQGLTEEDIAVVLQGSKKTHLAGATDMDPSNATLEMTLHHNLYHNAQDRLPRLRGGNAHAFNIAIDCAGNWQARDRIPPAAATAIAAAGFHFNVLSNGAISTEGGAVLLENSYINGVRYPLRNNQTAPGNPAYTGKILATDVMYVLGDLTFNGSSDAPGSPLAPTQAPIIPFAWNGFTQLPYHYRAAFAPAVLPRLSNPTDGAGAGVLRWAPHYWLQTSY